MATLIGHGLAGLIVLAGARLLAPRRSPVPITVTAAVGVAALACLPDVDLLVSYLATGSALTWHATATHTFFFAFAAAALIAAAPPWRGRRVAAFLLLFAALASHVLVDLLTGPQVGLTPSRGLAAGWPVSHEVWRMPLTVFRGVVHGGLAAWLSPRNLTTALTELLILGPLALGLLIAAARRTAAAPARNSVA